MCNDPNCKIHQGPIMEPVPGLQRHCDTTARNSECPYLKLGCKGCLLVESIGIPLYSDDQDEISHE